MSDNLRLLRKTDKNKHRVQIIREILCRSPCLQSKASKPLFLSCVLRDCSRVNKWHQKATGALTCNHLISVSFVHPLCFFFFDYICRLLNWFGSRDKGCSLDPLSMWARWRAKFIFVSMNEKTPFHHGTSCSTPSPTLETDNKWHSGDFTSAD